MPAGSPEVSESQLTDADVRRLQKAIVRFVEAGGRGSWVLGKTGDRRVKPALQKAVRRELNRDGAELYQAMIALENIGEKVFGETDRSIGNVAANREQARIYLSKHR